MNTSEGRRERREVNEQNLKTAAAQTDLPQLCLDVVQPDDLFELFVHELVHRHLLDPPLLVHALLHLERAQTGEPLETDGDKAIQGKKEPKNKKTYMSEQAENEKINETSQSPLCTLLRESSSCFNGPLCTANVVPPICKQSDPEP